ncbi:hypothetical protein [Flammeovirga kamogawensis]|uniref:Auto-transporter adhesin head GIN domain-containing protein n=1 Tax=Flammeovirga kamogawensis TaxID=373891 RepID=A0ABX8GQN8_9BACT|nr:hypothetical protein [Flammeovirga kamogawensis]MBB6462146.1 hypothetical protein [Flammeovirga kamogawensis]QWG05880.1 hypothetical protein KM029_10895 [Flammeovirga kamogawensis]TRX67704.1 hypothetical protein EO216_05905 [Flammeovirga kamogawensis]
MRHLIPLILLVTFFIGCNQQFYDRERSLEYSADSAFINQDKRLLCLRGNAYFIDPGIEIKADSIDISHKSGRVTVYGNENSPSEVYIKLNDIKVLGKFLIPGSKDNYYRIIDYYPQSNRIKFHANKKRLF